MAGTQSAKGEVTAVPERTYKIPLELQPQPEGGYTVTSPVLPELITEGDTVEEALANAEEAFVIVLEIYEDSGKALPEGSQDRDN